MLSSLKQFGYEVGSGILVGFPGQSYASLEEDLELIRTLDLNVILIGPYIPPSGRCEWQMSTGSSNQVPNTALSVYKIIALARQLCPGADIPSVTALATLSGDDAHLTALQRGANSLFLELTAATFPCGLRLLSGAHPIG